MDRAEWGGYAHIIMWSKIYQINIEIYCYKCIKLLYSNKSKWGDTDNHYDLMHPTVHQTSKTKSYSRRSDLQQIEYQKQEGNIHTYRHRQTLIGEEQKSQVEHQ
eukprot:16202048-Heterocapsa_arctica.AAC.1